SVLEFERRTSRFDICVFVVEAGGGLRISAEYRSDLFQPATIRRFLAWYARVLEAVAADSSQPVSALPLLDPAERRRLLVEWNATERFYPRDATIHGVVSGHAMARPDAVAVVCEAECLTYAELERRANQLARTFLAQGIRPGSLVGVS